MANHFPQDGMTNPHAIDNQGYHHYLTSNGQYQSYTTPLTTGHDSSAQFYMASTDFMGVPSQIPRQMADMTYQPQLLSPTTLYRQSAHNQRPLSRSYMQPLSESALADTEEQDSGNRDTMYSEAINPPMEGFPSVRDFDDLLREYVENLSPKKQDKALIHARRAANIKAVLINKKTTSVESAQFRFWVKKMFVLLPTDPNLDHRKRKICHEGKPIAIREKLFKILTLAHQRCQHGGRDKTSAQVRRVYSWVPKEIISRFVKICPTCRVRRGTNRSSPPDSDEMLRDDIGPESLGRRSSLMYGEMMDMSADSHLHTLPQLGGGNAVFQSQNRWMTGVPLAHGERKQEHMMHGLPDLITPGGFCSVNTHDMSEPSNSRSQPPDFCYKIKHER